MRQPSRPVAMPASFIAYLIWDFIASQRASADLMPSFSIARWSSSSASSLLPDRSIILIGSASRFHIARMT